MSPTPTLKWPGCKHVQITCNTLRTFHVQHVACHVVRRDSSAINFDRVDIACILDLFYWLVQKAQAEFAVKSYLVDGPE